METFVSRFLEKSNYLIDNEKKWSWEPNAKFSMAMATASTTCCGCTREYDGGTDVGADDSD